MTILGQYSRYGKYGSESALQDSLPPRIHFEANLDSRWFNSTFIISQTESSLLIRSTQLSCPGESFQMRLQRKSTTKKTCLQKQRKRVTTSALIASETNVSGTPNPATCLVKTDKPCRARSEMGKCQARHIHMYTVSHYLRISAIGVEG